MLLPVHVVERHWVESGERSSKLLAKLLLKQMCGCGVPNETSKRNPRETRESRRKEREARPLRLPVENAQGAVQTTETGTDFETFETTCPWF
jgi:hypothetical protein